MKLMQLLRLTGLAFTNGAGSATRVHTVEKFNRIIRRERERARSTGTPFTLVVIDTFEGGRANPSNWELINCLIERTRLTDDIGWMDDERIGVMLFDATTDDARRYIEQIGQLKAFKRNAFKVSIYCFSEAISADVSHLNMASLLKSVDQFTLGFGKEPPQGRLNVEKGKLAPARGF